MKEWLKSLKLFSSSLLYIIKFIKKRRGWDLNPEIREETGLAILRSTRLHPMQHALASIVPPRHVENGKEVCF